jgi:predicted alpha/beta-hydrolase family hydrolase
MTLACAVSVNAFAEKLTVTTARGEKVEVLADFPAGPGPFPTLVLAPGQAYPMTRPILEQTARQLVSQGIAVYRFNWARSATGPGGGAPSRGLVDELQDMHAVLAATKAEPRVDRDRLFVGGKSLGSMVAWRALAGDKSLKAGLFLTAVCSRRQTGQTTPTYLADKIYPGVASETRPLLFISGDQDPLCAPRALYRFAENSGGPARVAIVGGDHSYGNPALAGEAAERARKRNIAAVAQLAADFFVEIAGQQASVTQ